MSLTARSSSDIGHVVGDRSNLEHIVACSSLSLACPSSSSLVTRPSSEIAHHCLSGLSLQASLLSCSSARCSSFKVFLSLSLSLYSLALLIFCFLPFFLLFEFGFILSVGVGVGVGVGVSEILIVF